MAASDDAHAGGSLAAALLRALADDKGDEFLAAVNKATAGEARWAAAQLATAIRALVVTQVGTRGAPYVLRQQAKGLEEDGLMNGVYAHLQRKE